MTKLNLSFVMGLVYFFCLFCNVSISEASVTDSKTLQIPLTSTQEVQYILSTPSYPNIVIQTGNTSPAHQIQFDFVADSTADLNALENTLHIDNQSSQVVDVGDPATYFCNGRDLNNVRGACIVKVTFFPSAYSPSSTLVSTATLYAANSPNASPADQMIQSTDWTKSTAINTLSNYVDRPGTPDRELTIAEVNTIVSASTQDTDQQRLQICQMLSGRIVDPQNAPQFTANFYNQKMLAQAIKLLSK